MGWWKISGPSGHINWSAGIKNEGAKLFNCIPGRDDPAQLYNGDEPADILDAVVKNITTRLQDVNYRAEAKHAFVQQDFECVTLEKDDYCALQRASVQISDVYQREWRRSPTPAELSAVFEFCTSVLMSD
jgi:hypothetical protein